jgi:hypothetical protein
MIGMFLILAERQCIEVALFPGLVRYIYVSIYVLLVKYCNHTLESGDVGLGSVL